MVRRIAPNPSREELLRYWKNPDDAGNFPVEYIKGSERSEFLLSLLGSVPIERTSRILELGCNVGRNLNCLFSSGYRNLTGVEINPSAIRLMRQVYPKMAGQSAIIEGAIEDVIKDFGDGEFDLVFTMAVLMHIHPTSAKFVLGEISRVSKKNLVTIEHEIPTMSFHQFPRNYKKIFEHLGFKQILEITPSAEALENYVARTFAKEMM